MFNPKQWYTYFRKFKFFLCINKNNLLTEEFLWSDIQRLEYLKKVLGKEIEYIGDLEDKLLVESLLNEFYEVLNKKDSIERRNKIKELYNQFGKLITKINL